jgi:hypothetical protein
MPKLDKGSDVRKAITEALGKLEASGGRDALVFDSDHRRAIPGFGLRIFSSGRAFFILKYQVKGQGPRRVSLSEVAANDLDPQLVRLRQAAAEIKDHARVNGRDIVAERLKAEADRKAAEEQRRNAPTLRKLAPLYLRDRQRGKNDNGRELKRLKRNSLSQVRRYLQGTSIDPGIWGAIADTPLPRVGMRQLQDILEHAARTRGAAAADRARVALASFFSWAIGMSIRTRPTTSRRSR